MEVSLVPIVDELTESGPTELDIPQTIEWHLQPSIPREAKRDLIAAFQAGKVIQWSVNYPERDEWERWRDWDYRDMNGNTQPQLGHAAYLGGVLSWRVPEQEQCTVKYKIAIISSNRVCPEARAYTHPDEVLMDYSDVLFDKDDTEHSTTYWRVKP